MGSVSQLGLKNRSHRRYIILEYHVSIHAKLEPANTILDSKTHRILKMSGKRFWDTLCTFFKQPFLKKIHLGSVSSLGPEIKKSEPTEVPYLISPNGDIKDLTSYSNPRVSDEYAYKSRTGNTFTYWDIKKWHRCNASF